MEGMKLEESSSVKTNLRSLQSMIRSTKAISMRNTGSLNGKFSIQMEEDLAALKLAPKDKKVKYQKT